MHTVVIVTKVIVLQVDAPVTSHESFAATLHVAYCANAISVVSYDA